MSEFFHILRDQPELAIFITLAAGWAIGMLRIGKFRLGAVLGTLFAGVLIGQIGIPIHPMVKIIFFDFFLFATGYKVGPQFFRGLKKDALPQLALTVVICTTCLLSAFIAAKILGYDTGIAAGMLAGAFTESTVIGTAGEAILRLPISDQEKSVLLNNIPVAYAVTYLIGTIAIVYFLSNLAPRIIRIDLKEACTQLKEKISDNSGEEMGEHSAHQEWSMRAYRINNPVWIGKKVKDIENLMFPDYRIILKRIRRNEELLDPAPDTVIEADDVVAVMARRYVVLKRLTDIGPEVLDKEVLDFPLANRDIFITKKEAVNKNLRQLYEACGEGVVLNKLIRGGQEIPFTPKTVINRGDLMKVTGRLIDIQRAGRYLGHIEDVSPQTDMIFVGAGIFLGGLLGLLSITVGGLSMTLTTSGGALVMGLIFGWLHTKVPSFGKIPEAALWIFDNVGLATFIGIVGISAGPGFINGLHSTGISLLFAGLLVALIPHMVGLLFGRYILKMDPVILLGAHSGAGTTTTALKAIQEAAGSKLPALGYTIPYALGNILLTAWGPVIVAMMNW